MLDEPGPSYPYIDNHPVLIDEPASRFTVAGVLRRSPTTNDRDVSVRADGVARAERETRKDVESVLA